MSGAGNRDLIPDDFGILPGTFIRPVWKNMPSIFRDPKQRLQMEWLSLKIRVENFIRFGFAHFTDSS
jgi:protein MBA1